MTKLIWDGVSEKKYTTGVSRCVLYLKNDDLAAESSTDYYPGVAWNGIIDVTLNEEGYDRTDLSTDGQIYEVLRSYESLSGSITAYNYPKEFLQCLGLSTVTNGVYLGQQRHRKFAVCYRTEIGSDTEQPGGSNGYLIHILYNCTAKLPSVEYDTMNNSGDANEYEFELECHPVKSIGFDDFCEIVIHSDRLDPDRLKLLDMTLFGWENGSPVMPNPNELIDLITVGEYTNPWGEIPELVDLRVHENGVYYPNEGQAFERVVVNVSIPKIPTGVGLDVSENGTYFPSADTLYNRVTVSVSGGSDLSNYAEIDFPFLSGTFTGLHVEDSLGATQAAIMISRYTSVFSYLRYVDIDYLTVVPSHLFEAFHDLERVSFPRCVAIEGEAFLDSGLQIAYFPSCESISDSAFELCGSLQTAYFPNCVEVGSNAFAVCSSLENITLPRCERIGMDAFGGCTSIVNLALDNCLIIESLAFAGCTSLENLVIPRCEEISTDLFSACDNLKTVTLGCSMISSGTFQYCSLIESLYVLYNISGGSTLCSLDYPYDPPFGFSSGVDIYVPSHLYSKYVDTYPGYSRQFIVFEG